MSAKKLTSHYCQHKCGGQCCRYLMVKISPPKTRTDRDEHRWLLMHEGVQIRIESRLWYMLVHTPCKNLRENNLCAIYAERPDLCEEYSDCDGLYGPNKETIVFETVEQYDKFMAKRKKPWHPRKREPGQ